MISSSSYARISAQPWLGGALALACLLQPAMLPGMGHEPAADKPRRDREHDVGTLGDFGSKADFYSSADFCSMALVGSGDM